MYARGSRVDLPVSTVDRALPRSEDDGSGYDVVFYLGDGEQTADADTPSFRSVRSLVSAGAVLGYGTSEGGRMRLYTGRESGLDRYIIDDDTDEDAVSRIDEDALLAVAEELDIAYVHRTEPGGLDELAAGIAEGARRDLGRTSDGVRRLYWIPAFGLVGLALWQMAVTSLEIADARRAIRRPTGDVAR